MVIFYSSKEIPINDDLNVSVVTIDSKNEQKSKCWNEEPDYNLFCLFLSKMVTALAKSNEIFASFPERRSNASLINKLQKNELEYIASGLLESRVAIRVTGDKDILKIIKFRDSPFEWLYFHIGQLKKPSLMDDYQPIYLIYEGKHFNWNIYKEASMVVYHSCGIAYAEIISTSYDSKGMIAVVQNVYNQGNGDWAGLTLTPDG